MYHGIYVYIYIYFFFFYIQMRTTQWLVIRGHNFSRLFVFFLFLISINVLKGYFNMSMKRMVKREWEYLWMNIGDWKFNF